MIKGTFLNTKFKSNKGRTDCCVVVKITKSGPCDKRERRILDRNIVVKTSTTCNGGDEYSPRLGRMISESKAKIGVYKTILSRSNMVLRKKQAELSELQKSIEKHQRCLDREMSHYNKLVGNDE